MNKITIAPLQWESENDGITFALPYGFEDAYFITAPKTDANETDKFELALINGNGECDESTTSLHDTLEAAKSKAHEHFASLILAHIVH